MNRQPYFLLIDRTNEDITFGFLLAGFHKEINVKIANDGEELYSFNPFKMEQGITLIKISNEDYNEFFKEELTSELMWKVRDDAPIKSSLSTMSLFDTLLEKVTKPVIMNECVQAPLTIDEQHELKNTVESLLREVEALKQR